MADSPSWQPLFQDDFDRPDSGTVGNGWSADRASAWSIEDGMLKFYLDQYESGSWVDTTLSQPSLEPTVDQRIEFVIPDGPDPDGFHAAALRYTDEQDGGHFFGIIAFVSGGKLRFDGNMIMGSNYDGIMSRQSVNLPPGGAVRLVAQVEGNSPTTYRVDVYDAATDVQIFTITDTTTKITNTEGGMGVNAWQASGAPEVFFRNVVFSTTAAEGALIGEPIQGEATVTGTMVQPSGELPAEGHITGEATVTGDLEAQSEDWWLQFKDTFNRADGVVGNDWAADREDPWTIEDGMLKYYLPQYESRSWVDTSLIQPFLGQAEDQRIEFTIPPGVDPDVFQTATLRYTDEADGGHFFGIIAFVSGGKLRFDGNMIRGESYTTIMSRKTVDMPASDTVRLVAQVEGNSPTRYQVDVYDAATDDHLFTFDDTTTAITNTTGFMGVNAWQASGAPEGFFDDVAFYTKTPSGYITGEPILGQATVSATAEQPVSDLTGLTLTRKTRHRMELTWDPVAHAEYYIVERRRVDINGGWETMVRAPSLVIGYQEGQAERVKGATYEYRVLYEDMEENVSPPSVVVTDVVPAINLFMIGDSNVAYGASGTSASTPVRSYISGTRPVNADDRPDSLDLISGRIMDLEPLIEAINHAIAGTRTGTGDVGGRPDALHVVNGTNRFAAEVLGKGYLWDPGHGSARYNAMVPDADDWAYYAFGTNDIKEGTSVATIIANIKAAINLWTGEGLAASQMIIATIPPWPSNTYGHRIPDLNNAIKALASSHGVTVFDAASYVSNDDGATWIDGTYNKDDIHYTGKALDLLAPAIVDLIMTADSKLVGHIEGTATVAGTLTAPSVRMRGQPIQGWSIVQGHLGKHGEVITGTATSTSTATGALTSTVNVVGVLIQGAATVAGVLSQGSYIRGTGTSTSTATGVLTADFPATEVPVTGEGTSTSTATGWLVGRAPLVVMPVLGTATTSGVMGGQSRLRAQPVHGTATVAGTGTLYAILTGTGTSTSTGTGVLTADFPATEVPVMGTGTSASTATGRLSVVAILRAQPVMGAASVEEPRLRAFGTLAGVTIHGVAATSGAMTQASLLRGTATSTSTATLHGGILQGVLQGVPVVGVADVLADAFLEGHLRAEAIVAWATVDGLLGLSGAGGLAGYIIGRSTVTGFMGTDVVILERALQKLLAENDAVRSAFAPDQVTQISLGDQPLVLGGEPIGMMAETGDAVSYWDVAPPRTEAPYLVLQSISGQEGTIWDGGSDLTLLRVQVTVWARTRFHANVLREMVIRPALEGKVIERAFIGIDARNDLHDTTIQPTMHGASLDIILAQSKRNLLTNT